MYTLFYQNLCKYKILLLLIRNTTRKLGKKIKMHGLQMENAIKNFIRNFHEKKDGIKKILSALLMCQINNENFINNFKRI